MMVNVNIRMDEDLKKQFEFYCTELGLNMTSAFNVFARAVVRERGIPFDMRIGMPGQENGSSLEGLPSQETDCRQERSASHDRDLNRSAGRNTPGRER